MAIPQIELPKWDVTYHAIIDKLKVNENFAFSRWGDGEWKCILGYKGNNCDGHIYYPSLSKRLSEVIDSHPKYIMGMQPLSVRVMWDNISNKANSIEWVNADALHYASINGVLNKFTDAIKNRNIILVCGSYMKGINIFKPNDICLIDSVNCYLNYDATLREVKGKIKDNSVVLFCASMMSNVLIDDLFNLNNKCTYIDAGSVFDPYVGKISRSYHKTLKIA